MYFHSNVMLLYRFWHFRLDPESSKEATRFYVRDLLRILLFNIKRTWANYLISMPVEIIIKLCLNLPDIEK